MSSSSTQKPTPPRSADHPRLTAAKKALFWLTALVLAVAPYPWWW
jgi:hypothetical protein